MDRPTKQKISKETQTLNDTMDQLDLIDIYRTDAAAAKSHQLCPHGHFTLQPHGLQPTRLLHLWDLPGKSTGVGCHYLLQYIGHFTPKMNFTFFLSAHGTFSKIYHILGHKSCLGKFKKIEIIPSIFSNHNALRLDVNYRGKKTIKHTYIWRLNNTLLNNQNITEEIKKRN